VSDAKTIDNRVRAELERQLKIERRDIWRRATVYTLTQTIKALKKSAPDDETALFILETARTEVLKRSG